MKTIFAVVALLFAISANADGLLNLGKNTYVQGVPNLSVHVQGDNDAQNTAKCQTEYDDAIKQLKAAGYSILATKPCFSMTPMDKVAEIYFVR